MIDSGVDDANLDSLPGDILPADELPHDGRVHQIGAPESIYSHPADTFVATFVGSPVMNIFQGQIVRERDRLKFLCPDFSLDVRHMTGTLEGRTVEVGVRPEDIGLSKQQTLHDNIVDEGLGKLYKRFLDKAESIAVESGIVPEVNLLRGKTFAAVVDLSNQQETDLIIAGRFGHHRDDQVTIGSNSEAIVRHAQTNVLITV